MDRFRKLRHLSPCETAVLGQAWLLYSCVDLGLRLLPFQSLLGLTKRIALLGAPRRPGPLHPAPLRLAWLVEVAGRYSLARATCLRQALVLSILLARRGVPSQLRLGVARKKGVLKAHAWLEPEGSLPLGIAEPREYSPLYP